MSEHANRYVAIRHSFLGQIAEREYRSGSVVKRDGFRKWLMGPEGGRQQDPSIWFGRLTAGDSVPVEVAVGYVNYVISRQPDAWRSVEALDQVVDMPAPLHPRIKRKFNVLAVMLRIARAFGALKETRGMRIPPGTRDRDIPDAAAMIVSCVGHLTTAQGEAFDYDDCLRRGEAKMRRTLGEFTNKLMEFHRVNPNTVMFAVCPQGARMVRVAAGVIVPLSDAAMGRMAAGSMEDMDITAQDIVAPSPNLYVAACGIDHARHEEVGENKSFKAQIHTMMYMGARLVMNSRKLTPRIIAPITNDEYKERLMEQGYRPLGTTTRVTKVPLAIMDEKCEEGKFDDMCSVFKAYCNRENMRKWQQEDDAADRT